jgi:hypothetical protein
MPKPLTPVPCKPSDRHRYKRAVAHKRGVFVDKKTETPPVPVTALLGNRDLIREMYNTQYHSLKACKA